MSTIFDLIERERVLVEAERSPSSPEQHRWICA